LLLTKLSNYINNRDKFVNMIDNSENNNKNTTELINLWKLKFKDPMIEKVYDIYQL